MAAEPEDSALKIPKSAIGYDPELVPSTSHPEILILSYLCN
jgi:hypothetical protein